MRVRTHRENRKKRKPYEFPHSVFDGVAGQRARDPPDPIPNSEVKPRSVFGISVVFGHAKPGKLAAPLQHPQKMEDKYSRFITLFICNLKEE